MKFHTPFPSLWANFCVFEHRMLRHRHLRIAQIRSKEEISSSRWTFWKIDSWNKCEVNRTKSFKKLSILHNLFRYLIRFRIRNELIFVKAEHEFLLRPYRFQFVSSGWVLAKVYRRLKEILIFFIHFFIHKFKFSVNYTDKLQTMFSADSLSSPNHSKRTINITSIVQL